MGNLAQCLPKGNAGFCGRHIPCRHPDLLRPERLLSLHAVGRKGNVHIAGRGLKPETKKPRQMPGPEVYKTTENKMNYDKSVC